MYHSLYALKLPIQTMAVKNIVSIIIVFDLQINLLTLEKRSEVKRDMIYDI